MAKLITERFYHLINFFPVQLLIFLYNPFRKIIFFSDLSWKPGLKYTFFQISASPISEADFLSKIADELVRQNREK